MDSDTVAHRLPIVPLRRRTVAQTWIPGQGTVTVRPSRSQTRIASSATSTSRTLEQLSSATEVVIPLSQHAVGGKPPNCGNTCSGKSASCPRGFESAQRISSTDNRFSAESRIAVVPKGGVKKLRPAAVRRFRLLTRRELGTVSQSARHRTYGPGASPKRRSAYR